MPVPFGRDAPFGTCRNVTVWSFSPLQTHVTRPPRATRTVFGLKKSSLTETRFAFDAVTEPALPAAGASAITAHAVAAKKSVSLDLDLIGIP
jgi:hypothetical protein